MYKEDKMRKLLQFLFILAVGVFCCACVNTFAVHELNEKAYKYIEEGDNEAAIARLEASVDLDGDLYETRYNLANIYLSTNKCDRAVVHAEHAAKLKKNEPIIHYVLGLAATCAADDIYEQNKPKQENNSGYYGGYYGQKQAQSTMNERALSAYLDYLNKANTALNAYLQIVPQAEDAQRVADIVKDNENKIETHSKG